jgi:phosphate transport system protein
VAGSEAGVRDSYQEDIDGLSERLVEMTQLVRLAMAQASGVLLAPDLRLAEEVISRDDQVDKLEAEIEDSVLSLMAGRQPAAEDLRLIVTALRMSRDLERMGDLAVHLAKAARRRHPDPAIPPALQPTISEMAQIAGRLVTKAGSVIASRDVRKGLEMDADDDQMDRLHRRLFTALLTPEWTYGIECAVDVTLIGRYFERFADHAVQLAENVVYLVTGERPHRYPGRLAP